MANRKPVTMNVIIAARLSQASTNETGIDSQDEDTKSWCRLEGHNIVEVVADHKSGAADWMARKNLRPWLTDPDKLVRYPGDCRRHPGPPVPRQVA